MKIKRSHASASQPATVLVSRSKSELMVGNQFGPRRRVCLVLFCKLPNLSGIANDGRLRSEGGVNFGVDQESGAKHGRSHLILGQHRISSVIPVLLEEYKHDCFIFIHRFKLGRVKFRS